MRWHSEKWNSWSLIREQDGTNVSFISGIHVRFFSCGISLTVSAEPTVVVLSCFAKTPNYCQGTRPWHKSNVSYIAVTLPQDCRRWVRSVRSWALYLPGGPHSHTWIPSWSCWPSHVYHFPCGPLHPGSTGQTWYGEQAILGLCFLMTKTLCTFCGVGIYVVNVRQTIQTLGHLPNYSRGLASL